MKAPSSEWRARAARLKKLGVLDIDLRLALTQKQKRRIARLEKRFKPELNSPDRYALRYVSDETARKLRRVGHHVWTTETGRKRVSIRTPSKKSSVHIRRGSVLTIDHESSVMYRDILSDKNIIQQAREVSKRLGPYDQLTLRIGGNSPFRRAFSLRELENYLAAWMPKPLNKDESLESRKKRRAELMPQMSVVTVMAGEEYE